MIEVKFIFPNPAEAAAFLVSVQNIGVRAGGAEPGLALETGEFIPAKELNKPKNEKVTDPKPTPAPKPAAEPSAPAAPAASTASSTEAVAYPVLQKAVFTLAGKSREAATEVAASFGVKTFKELAANPDADPKVTPFVEKEPGLFAKALAAVEAKIAELG